MHFHLVAALYRGIRPKTVPILQLHRVYSSPYYRKRRGLTDGTALDIQKILPRRRGILNVRPLFH